MSVHKLYLWTSSSVSKFDWILVRAISHSAAQLIAIAINDILWSWRGAGDLTRGTGHRQQ